MSDDEDITFIQKSRTVHYGSLEEQERARLAAAAALGSIEIDDGDAPPGVSVEGKELGEVHISNEYMELEEEMSKDKQALLEEFERRRKARQINVSTDDGEVRKSLRQLGEPVCLFGEGPAERRARLRDLLSFLGEDAIHKKMEEEEARLQAERGQEGTWYHEGDSELRECRLWIAHFSLPRARARLREAREQATTKQRAKATLFQELQKKLTTIQPIASQVGDQRPLASCCFSSDSQMLLTSAWSGLCKVWSVPDCSLLQTLRGHSSQVSAAVFKPGVRKQSHYSSDQLDSMEVDNQTKELSMASCGYDGTVKLWNFASEEPIGELRGHEPHRVSRLAFHPSSRFLATCCRDSSWRLWDLTTGTEILYQEGHARPPHDISFQEDGSLAATGGLDAFGRVWDLRTGRCVMFMEGHLKAVYTISWSPSGYELATGGGDHAVRIWDLRTRQCLHTLPAHNNIISSVRWQRTSGLCITSASYDCALKIWAHKSWQALRTLQGHDSKIMAMDMSYDDKYIVSAAYDRTFKLWSADGC